MSVQRHTRTGLFGVRAAPRPNASASRSITEPGELLALNPEAVKGKATAGSILEAQVVVVGAACRSGSAAPPTGAIDSRFPYQSVDKVYSSLAFGVRSQL